MAEGNATLGTFYENWNLYQDHLKQAIAPLTAEQLGLRAAPGLKSISEIVTHIIGARVYWFTGFMGEEVGEASPLVTWDEPGAPARSAAQLVWGLDASWKLMADALARWDSADMQEKVHGRGDSGKPIEPSRSRVVWHILEHDLHHGGEVSLTLGMHGLQAPDI